MPAVITNEMVFAALPPRPPESHKGAYGRVLAVCGCPAYRGAAALSVLGALRAGAGVVTLAAGESVIQSIAARVLEATFLPLPDESALASMAETATVCLAGCGREADETTAREMKLLLERTRGTVVLDAGGLCSLAAEKQAMRPAAGRLFCFAARPTGGCFYYVPLPRVLQPSSAVFSLTNVTEYDTVKSTTIVNEKGGTGQCRKNRLKNCRRLSWT